MINMRIIIVISSYTTPIGSIAMDNESCMVNVKQIINPNSVQIHGNTNINASAQNVNITSIDSSNTAKTSVSANGK
ncbi:MAG: hypothetical protein FD153_2064 [Rhodospirillaceae bacterium]|nr:MAG: hypothetical protein FD153_2064 [Rhodospirillaceae bacterium]